MTDKTAAYCDGFLAFQTRKDCRYTPEQPELRAEWAAGFLDGLNSDLLAKIWYKSKTLWAGVFCLIVGSGLLIYGMHGQSTSGVVIGQGYGASVGAGLGTMASSLIFTALRFVTKEPVAIGGATAYGNQPWGQ